MNRNSSEVYKDFALQAKSQKFTFVGCGFQLKNKMKKL